MLRAIDVAFAFQVFLMLYFLGLHGGYIMLNIVSIFSIVRYRERQDIDNLPQIYLGLEPPVSVLVPAHNEERTIVASVNSMLQLDYSEHEVIVVNDGSQDGTMEVLIKAFDLVPFPEAYRKRLETRPIRAIYQSSTNPNLRVIDKENGGKADSLNAGINASRYPLYCGVDADSILQRESLQRVIQPFLEDPLVVASGGCVRVANGSLVKDGYLIRTGLPDKLLALFQIAEYLRAFLFGRLGWSPMNAPLIISGAFGVFNKEAVIQAGGYRTETIGEDMELVVRLHRVLSEAGRPYKIVFVPDPICWTEAPEDLTTLKNQRVRWQRGLGESLMANKSLLFSRKAKAVGWLAFPFMLFFEWLGPLLEVGGYIFMTFGYLIGIVSLQSLVVFLFLAIGLGILLSISALLLEEVSFHVYPKFRHVLLLFLAVVAENLGYRQLTSIWRLMGIFKWAFGKKGHSAWGAMKRTGAVGS